MPAIEEADELPPNEKSFEIEVARGDTTGTRYVGKFKSVCVQTPKQKSEADLMRARLNGPNPLQLTEETRLYHVVISELHHRLKAAPKWFREADNGMTVMDMNVLVAIFNECIKAETEWREKVWGPAVKADQIEASDEETDDEDAGDGK